VIQLLGFAKVSLKPGEQKSVNFKIHTDRLAYTGKDYKKIVDPGLITISVGCSRSQLFSAKNIQLTGPVRNVAFDRELRTPVSILEAK
jgi:beta-glucosidase